MQWFRDIWNWIKGWFTSEDKDTPSVDETVDMETVPDISDNLQEAEVKPKDQKKEHQKNVEFTRDAIAKYAEMYEWNQVALIEDAVKFIDGEPVVRPLFVEAAYLVDWSSVVAKYTQETMHKLGAHGTEFNFKGHKDLQRYIMDAVHTESANRSGPAPDRNGMGSDGFPR